MDRLKMYFLLEMVIFQPAMLDYQRVPAFNRKYIDSIRGPHFPASELLDDPGV